MNEKYNVIIEQLNKNLNSYDDTQLISLFSEIRKDWDSFSDYQKYSMCEKGLIIETKNSKYEVCQEFLKEMDALADRIDIKCKFVVQFWKINILIDTNNLQIALAETQKLLKTMKKSNYNNSLFIQNVLNTLLRIYINLDDVKKAKSVFKRIVTLIDLELESKLKLYFNMGIMYFENNDLKKAKHFFLFVSKHQEFPIMCGKAYNYLAKTTGDLSYFEKAYACFESVDNKALMNITLQDRAEMFESDCNS